MRKLFFAQRTRSGILRDLLALLGVLHRIAQCLDLSAEPVAFRPVLAASGLCALAYQLFDPLVLFLVLPAQDAAHVRQRVQGVQSGLDGVLCGMLAQVRVADPDHLEDASAWASMNS